MVPLPIQSKPTKLVPVLVGAVVVQLEVAVVGKGFEIWVRPAADVVVLLKVAGFVIL